MTNARQAALILTYVAETQGDQVIALSAAIDVAAKFGIRRAPFLAAVADLVRAGSLVLTRDYGGSVTAAREPGR